MTAPPQWQDPNPPSKTDPRAPTVLAVAAGLLTILVLVTLVAVVTIKRGSVMATKPAATHNVVLTAANVPVSDPFTPSAVTAQTAAQITTDTAQFPMSTTRGVRLVSGIQPGLYGGRTNMTPCNVTAIATFLQGDADRASAWAEALDIQPQLISAYLNTLTPVVLTTDTWVTSHGYSGDRVSPSQTVLQAGNAVLIDPAGVPRVRCASGNPLEPSANQPFSALSAVGQPWPGYSPQSVVAIAYTGEQQPLPTPVPTTPVTKFDLVDLTTAEPLTQPAGAVTDPAQASSKQALPDPIATNTPPDQPET